MELFKKKHKCLICNRKFRKGGAEVRYSYSNEDGEAKIGKAMVCQKCADKMDQNKMDYSEYESF